MWHLAKNILSREVKERLSKPLYRNSLFLMANTFAPAGLGFFFWMIVARYYSPAEVGLGAGVISATCFLALISSFGFDVALIRFLGKAQKPIEMINSCFTWSGAAVLVLSLLFLAGLDLWSPALGFIKRNAIFFVAFICFALILTLSELLSAVFIARRRADFVLLKSMIFSLLKIPLPILFALFFPAFGIVNSWGIAILVAFTISIFLFLPRLQNGYRPYIKFDIAPLKNIGKYSAGNYLANLMIVAPSLVLPLLVVNLLGARQNAYFYVPWMIASLLIAIPEAISDSLFAEGSHSEKALSKNVRRSFIFAFTLLIPALILLLLLSKWVLLLFGASYPVNALLLLQLLALSSLPAAVSRIYLSVLRVQGRTKELLIISSFTTIPVLLGSYFVMPKIGIVGAGYTWLATNAAASVYILWAMRAFFRRRGLSTKA